MGLRKKVKRAFTRSSSSSQSSTPSGERNARPNNNMVRTDIEYYKPGEIPRSKYKGPWNKEHQEKLHAFSFNFGQRPKSVGGSEYSPMASRAPSRRSSWISAKRPSLSARSHRSLETKKSTIGQKVEENEEGDDDVANVGLSRHQSPKQEKPRPTSPPLANGTENENPLEQSETITLNHQHDAPFNEEELTKALTAATLKPRKDND